MKISALETKHVWKIYSAISTTIVLWSSAFVGIRIGLSGYSPGALALLRFSIASIVIFFFYIKLSKHHSIKFKELPIILIIGIIGIGLYNITLNYGEITVSASISSFIIGMMPVLTMIISIFLLKESIALQTWLGIFISFIGLAIIALGEHGGVAFDYGVLFVFIAAICGGIYTSLQKYSLKKFHPIEMTAFAIWGGTLLLLIFTPQLINELPHAPLKATFSAIYMGIFPGAIAYAAWNYALSYLPASRVAPSFYTIPIVSTLLGYVLLNELPTWISMLGGLITLTGAVIVKLVKT